MVKEIKVQEGIEYCIGQFECPNCKKKVEIYCRKTPTRPHRHFCKEVQFFSNQGENHG